MSKAAINTKLDRLNALLRKQGGEFKFPDHRSYVSSSGSNQDWLKKALRKHPSANPEIGQLLELPFKKLLEPYVAPAEA